MDTYKYGNKENLLINSLDLCLLVNLKKDFLKIKTLKISRLHCINKNINNRIFKYIENPEKNTCFKLLLTGAEMYENKNSGGLLLLC